MAKGISGLMVRLLLLTLSLCMAPAGAWGLPVAVQASCSNAVPTGGEYYYYYHYTTTATDLGPVLAGRPETGDPQLMVIAGCGPEKVG